jgi:antitoxin component of MazEF toxin-antitoxin module
MAQSRRVRKVGNSFVVALPADIRKHFGITDGADVYWHRPHGKEVLLSAGQRRVGGRPTKADAPALLDQARREIARLHQKLAARPEAIYRQGFAVGFSQGLKYDIAMSPRLDAILTRMGEVYEAVIAKPRVALRVPAPPTARPKRERPAMEVPAPPLSADQPAGA